MAFRDFAYPEVRQLLGLSFSEEDLFGTIVALDLSSEFLERMRNGVDVGLAINTEKARSEFIIAPILMELRRLLGARFALFSGVEFDVDAARGLNGFCDFILTRSPIQSEITAPIVTIAEAKNDNIRNGMGQCVAAMVAAREFNAKSGPALKAVFGVVTTGFSWKFLKLAGSALTLDVHEYSVESLGRIMGILAHILQNG